MNKALVFLGMPGSGKGTQAKLLQKEFDFVQISTGEILRKEVIKKTLLGNEIKKLMDLGGLVSDKIVERLLDKNIQEGKNYIFDGFPRNLDQAVFLEKFLLSKKIILVKVFYFDVEVDYVVKRILERRVCSICSKEFSITFHKIKNNVCPDCKKQSLVVREDDNELTIKNRVEVYLKESYPVLDFYINKGVLFKVNAMDTIDVVFRNISKELLSIVR